MNTIELQRTLLTLASDYCDKYHFEYLKAIVNCIIKYYLTMPNYYEENAITTFKRFLESGVLSW